MNDKEKGRKIKELMAKRGFKQDALAAIFPDGGISAQAVSNWCNGKGFPRPERWAAMESALQAPPGWFAALYNDQPLPTDESPAPINHPPPIEDATKLAMRCLCEGIIQWWIETHGTAPIVPDTFIAEFAERFPEYAVWRLEFFEQARKEAMA